MTVSMANELLQKVERENKELRARVAELEAALAKRGAVADGEREACFVIVQWPDTEDACEVARTFGPRSRAFLEAMNYAAQYEEDGPVKVIEEVEVARTITLAASQQAKEGGK